MIEHDGYWYPLMNEVARNNLGYGSEMSNILAHVRDWSMAIDGGAQIGRVANRLAEKFDLVIAVELAASNYKCLARNAVPGVQTIHGCLCNAGGQFFTASPDKHPDSPVCRAFGCHEYVAGAVRGVTIDQWNLGSCGFIKLDLQGYEFFALLGAEQTLRKFHPPLFIEHDLSCMGRYGVEADMPGKFLTGLGYEFLGTDDGNQLWA